MPPADPAPIRLDEEQYYALVARGDRIETFVGPDPAGARWAEAHPAVRGERIPLVALPGLSLAVDELLPRR